MDKNDIIKKLREVKQYLNENYGVTELALFGSYSRDEQTEKSDIDIMFDYKGCIGMEFFDICYTLDDLVPGKNAQVVSKRGLKEKYFNALKRDLVYA